MSGNNSNMHTNIEVCVRIKPLLKGVSKGTTTSPSKRPTGLARHGQRHLTSRTNTVASPTRTDSFTAWDVVSNDTVQQSPKMLRIQGRTISYTLDRVYGPQTKTNSLYEESVQPVVLSSLDGYHASVFCYGQTSTGKTHTMMGNPTTSPGIAPLAIEDIFSYIEQQDEHSRDYLIRVSYLEIYNEQIIDLLSDTPSSIRIFESKEAGVVVRGQREEVVSSPKQVMSLLRTGERRRQVGSTNMNKHSSRSHVILRIWMESKSHDALNGKARVSSLCLVDLAGSESVRLTGSTGERKREGQYINKSLMALGQVIYKLSDDEDRKTHIPYRDSKLTRLLQPSLSGNAQVVCICNISPQSSHLEESHNTLKFALRAKRIQQRPVLNEVHDQDTLLQAYKEEIDDLRLQLAEAKLEAEEQQQTSTTTTTTTSRTSLIDEEHSQELVAAIGRVEALILKTQKRKQEVDDDDLLITMSGESPTSLLASPEPQATSAMKKLSVDTSPQRQDADLMQEMGRIQGLLSNVLRGRGGDNRDAQVEELKTQLQEQEVTTDLKRADAAFLQSQLREKDALLEEVSNILEAMEKRQIQLEAENASLKQLVADQQNLLGGSWD